MCGIIGVIGSLVNGFSTKEQEIFEQLLYVDALRGKDATGVFVIDGQSGVQMIKENSETAVIAWNTAYRDLMTHVYKQGKVAVGHNRKKTIGADTDENAHPFIVNEEFVFVHNGTLYNHQKLAKTTVDSEALAIHIHAAGTDVQAIGEAMWDVYGAYACVWFDQRNGQLCLLRNKERPLHLAKLKSGGWVFASELGMIFLIANRNGYVVETHFELEVDNLYTFDLSKNYIDTYKKEALAKPVFTQVPPFTPGSFAKKTGEPDEIGAEWFSKNKFKRWKSQVLKTVVSFIVEDYVEKYPENETDDKTPVDWIIYGSLEQRINDSTTYYPHTIICRLPQKTVEEITDKYDGNLFGTISEMEYDAKSNRAILTLDSVRLPYVQLVH